MERLRPVLIASGVVLTLTDALSTVAAIGLLGAVEANPLMAALIGAIGLEAAMLVRAVTGVLLIGVLAALARHPDNRIGHGGLVIAVAALAIVNVSNGYQVGSHLLAAS